MIGNIAHQWRQPLSVISTCATGLILEKESGLLNDKRLIKSLYNIHEHTRHLSKTIDTFRNYLNTTKEYCEVIFQDSIKESLRILDSTFKNNFITLKTNIDEIEPIKIKLVKGEFSEVLINILNNAKDVLLIEKVTSPWIELLVKKESDKIIVTIEDNGGGIDPKIIDRIFEPYFTTKHKSQGTGLGLHMSYKIVTESLKGSIYVKNTNNGAKFFIEIPYLNNY
jgi:signal transduction histidine kinase